MTYKKFCEEAQIVYTLYVEVNGEETAKIQALSEEGLTEQLRKVDFAVDNKLKEQYEEIDD